MPQKNDEFHSDDGEQDEEDCEDSDEVEGDLVISCPYCGSEDVCEHQILFHSQVNGDWDGLLPDATKKIEEELVAALHKLFKAGKEEEVEADYPLAQLIETACQEGCDSESATGFDFTLWEYWLELIDMEPDCIRDDMETESGYPGGGDTQTVVHAKKPEAVIHAVIARCESDVAAIKAVL